ncbi:hypothetical protein KKC97_02695 [bacterium]|nr:hypothetical protein [bacterium]MBU1636551.1 hypothetical protein [bacterium]
MSEDIQSDIKESSTNSDCEPTAGVVIWLEDVLADIEGLTEFASKHTVSKRLLLLVAENMQNMEAFLKEHAGKTRGLILDIMMYNTSKNIEENVSAGMIVTPSMLSHEGNNTPEIMVVSWITMEKFLEILKLSQASKEIKAAALELAYQANPWIVKGSPKWKSEFKKVYPEFLDRCIGNKGDAMEVGHERQ